MIAADPGERFSSYDDLVRELELARRALETGGDGGDVVKLEGSRLRLPPFSKRLFEHARGIAREFAERRTLIRGTLAALLVAAAILFVLQRGLSRSWADVMALATSLVDCGPWNRALGNYKDQVALYHFDQAADGIRNTKLIGTYFDSTRAIAEERARLLFDWKNTLIDDLNRAHFAGMLTDRSGTQYTGIASATDESLSMKLPYGIARLTWDQVPLKELLAVSKSFIDPGARDAADRQWRCAAFASETGQTQAAQELADAAAKTRPAYRGQVPQLLQVTR